MLCNTGHCVDIVTIHVHVHALQVHVYVCTAGIIITTCGGGGLSKPPTKFGFPFCCQNSSSRLQSGRERERVRERKGEREQEGGRGPRE